MPRRLATLCQVCRGAGQPSGPDYCHRCKGRGEVPAVCECGEPAVVDVNGVPMCEWCAEIESETD